MSIMAQNIPAYTYWFTVNNNCSFPVWFNMSMGRVHDNFQLLANEALIEIATDYVPVVSNGTFTVGTSRDSPGLSMNWGYDSSGKTLSYSFALDSANPWDFLKHHNGFKVLNPNGTNSSCYSYDCKPGDSKCYWTQEYPATETCTKPQFFNATLCL